MYYKSVSHDLTNQKWLTLRRDDGHGTIKHNDKSGCNKYTRNRVIVIGECSLKIIAVNWCKRRYMCPTFVEIYIILYMPAFIPLLLCGSQFALIFGQCNSRIVCVFSLSFSHFYMIIFKNHLTRDSEWAFGLYWYTCVSYRSHLFYIVLSK